MQSSFGSVIIFYTLDGSEPTFSSSSYSAPITVGTSVVVRAMAMNNVDFSTTPVTDPVQLEIVPVYTVATSTPGGGSVSVNPATGPYPSNSVVTVTATPSSGWSFLNWTGDVTGTNPTAQVVMNGNKSIQAIFGTAINRSVTGNGSVLIDPPAGPYPFGSRVTLSAVPNAGAYFTLWGGAAAGNSVSPLRYAVTSANPTISALFSALGANQYSLTPLVNGAGMITLNPAKNVFNSGEQVTLTATPDIGWLFVNWSGDAASQTNVISIVMNSSKTVTANFNFGAVVAWGYNDGGQIKVPARLSDVVAVAGGFNFSLALRADGTVAAWGLNYISDWIPMTVPAGLSNVVAVASGSFHSLALRADGTVVGWGRNDAGQASVPTGLSNVVAVASGGQHSLALRADGTVAAWGYNNAGETSVPAGLSNVVAVVGGGEHSLALGADGTVAAWGWNAYGQSSVPAGLRNVVAVAGGGHHSLALRADGTVVAWGYNGFGQASVPTGLNHVVAVAAGDSRNLALTGPTMPEKVMVLPLAAEISPGSSRIFIAYAVGSVPLTYQWRKAGVDISGATNKWLQLTNVQSADVGNYTVVVSSSYGSVESQSATLTLAKASQTIDSPALADKTYGDPPFTVSAAASSGLPVTFSIVSGPATISGNTITITGAGTVVVRASQPGNENYSPAPDVDRTFTVAKATATVSLSGLTATYDGSPKPVTVTTVPAGLATSVTYNGSATVPVNANSYTVSAVVNDANYQGSGSGTLIIAKANQTIDFGALADKTFGDAPFAISAAASSGLPVTFSILSGPATIAGNTVTLTGGGAVTVRAAQAGNENYNPAPDVDRAFAVTKATATVTLSGLSATYDGNPKPVTVTTAPVGLNTTVTYNGSATVPVNANSYTNSYTVSAVVNDANYQGTA
ncbi:MAG: MBG domain-containing protein, partial [Verrucomicrobiota bacterium]